MVSLNKSTFFLLVWWIGPLQGGFTISGFCNWGPDGTASTSTCAGGAQGGKFCNKNKKNCVRGCDGRWCKDGATTKVQGFCNYGPDGTAGSSTCKGGAQGGTWCNKKKKNCVKGCDGKWCTSSSSGGGGNNSGTCPEGWQQASWTTYTSYPACCPDSPNYNPNADTTECDDFSGCDYIGDFAYLGHKSLDYVKSNNLVAFFTNDDNNASYGNKKIRLSASGKTIEATIADTCGDSDCGGCCTKNAQPSGYLVDMEYWTVINNFGAIKAAQGQICWQLV